MANGPGVSLRPVEVDEDGSPAPGSRWRLRWREHGKQRSKWFAHPEGSRSRAAPAAAVKMHAAILEALQAGELPSEAIAPPTPRRSGTIDEAAASWIRHKAARGLAASTVERVSLSTSRFLRAVRELRRVPDGQAVPLALLSRDLFSEVALKLRAEGLAEGTIRHVLSSAAYVWDWAADDEAAFGQVPPPPRTKSALVPRAPTYSAPTPPTLEEMDAVIAAIPRRANLARAAAIMQRFTGLRAHQVFHARRADLDVKGCRFRVRHGKSAREKVDQRVIPVSPLLVDELAPYLGDDPEGPLLRRRRDFAWSDRYGGPSETIRAAWESCTAAGTVRAETWQGGRGGRVHNRPDHAFRSGLQAFLVGQGVAEPVVDYLVGHAGSLRSRHYVPPEQRFELAREAVALLPAIRWPGADEEPEAAGGDVLRFPGRG